MSNLERYNECCGIAKIKKCGYLEKDTYVVYFNGYDLEEENGLGEVIGKGTTKEEALIQALKILSKSVYKQVKIWSEIFEIGEKIGRTDLFKLETPILTLRPSNDEDYETNASVFLMDNGNVCLGIL